MVPINHSDPMGHIPQWKRVLYYLQLEAPPPKKVECNIEIPSTPSYYGAEFHGEISRQETDLLLVEDGCYLVRESQRNRGCYTLAIRFNNATKNFKLYYNAQSKEHYVGEKYFERLDELVADGLICFYVMLKGQDYITNMAEDQSIYEESPYVRYRQEMMRKTRTRTPRHRQSSVEASANSTGPGTVSSSPSGQIGSPALPPRPATLSRDCTSHSMRHSHALVPPMLPDAPPPSRLQAPIVDSSVSAVDGFRMPSSARQADEWLDIMKQEKAHNFKATTFKVLGAMWCDFCGHFMWGLIAQGVECQDCGVKAHKKCSERLPNDCMPSMKKLKRMFGLDLTTLLKATNKSIPYLVEKCVEEIEGRGLQHEGMYRVAGFHDDIEAIKQAFDIEGDADITAQKYPDINTITSVLKLFLRLLPVPLITFDIYPLLTQTITIHRSKQSELDMRPLLADLRGCMDKLPTAHYQTLKYIMGHLNRVIQHTSRNMMTSATLSIVFAPTVLQSPQTDPLEAKAYGQLEQQVIELLITHYFALFER